MELYWNIPALYQAFFDVASDSVFARVVTQCYYRGSEQYTVYWSYLNVTHCSSFIQSFRSCLCQDRRHFRPNLLPPFSIRHNHVREYPDRGDDVGGMIELVDDRFHFFHFYFLLRTSNL